MLTNINYKLRVEQLKNTQFKALNVLSQYDPTHTLTLRAIFAADMARRFTRLKKLIDTSIVENDCFGLLPSNTIPLRKVLGLEAAASKQFDFPTSEDKVKAFMGWLRQQEDNGILEVIQRQGPEIVARNPWMNIYIDSAYKKGILRAQIEMSKIGIPNAKRPLNYAFLSPIHADRVGLIYTRAFEDLKTVIQVMNSQIQRKIADGLSSGLALGIAQGKNPLTIARELMKDVNNHVDKIGITRAKMIARTEVIRAHHVATVNEYRSAGIDGVIVKAEWETAGVGVCEHCQKMSNRKKPYTLDEIEPLIPAHPHCRCCVLPVLPEEVEKLINTPANKEIFLVQSAPREIIDSLLERFKRNKFFHAA